MKNEYIEMGTCSKPHGIKGDFIFSLFNNGNSSLNSKSEILLKPGSHNSSLPSEGKLFNISSIRFGNKVIAKLEGVDNRNQVEEMIPFSIWLERKNLAPLDEDEVYLEDLVNLTVFDPDGVQLGIVENYYDNGAQPVLVVKLDDVTKESQRIQRTQRIELPFVEVFFPEIDLDEERIVMNNPGMF